MQALIFGVFVLAIGVFLVCQWAFKEAGTSESEIQRFNVLLNEIKAQQDLYVKTQDLTSLALMIGNLTEEQKKLEAKCVDSIGAFHSKLVKAEADTHAATRDISVMKASQVALGRRMDNLNKTVTLKFDQSVPISIIEAKKGQGKGALLKRAEGK